MRFKQLLFFLNLRKAGGGANAQHSSRLHFTNQNLKAGGGLVELLPVLLASQMSASLSPSCPL